jgi:hypothetical protein
MKLKDPIYEATCSLCGGAYFVMQGNDAYENIVQWFVETPPTKEEVEIEAIRLQAKYERNEYQRQRAQEYPPITDQLDTLYHGGYDAWKASIDAVKLKYPKPE